MPAGYSKRPLKDKLGIKPGFRIFFHNAPENFTDMLGVLPESTSLEQALGSELDYIHFFTKDRNELQQQFLALRNAIKKNGMIWISWPKKASKVKTNLDENLVRATGLKTGLVDIKVCAVDEIWSGLKFVIPVKDRA